MGLKSTIQNAVESVIVAVGDLAESIEYNAKSIPSYSVSTGKVSHTVTVYTVSAIIEPQGGKIPSDRNADEFTGDIKVIIASNDLSVTPDTNDTIQWNSVEYAIQGIIHDPAFAHYELTCVRLG